jgi:hypothetical protein
LFRVNMVLGSHAMGDLQRELERQLGVIPRLVATQVVREKFAAAGVNDPDFEKRVIDHLIDGDGGDAEWADQPDVEIHFTAGDCERAVEIAAELTGAVSEIVEELPKQIAPEIVHDLRRQWRDNSPAVYEAREGFRRRLEERWGGPLNDLRLLLELCRDTGAEFQGRHLRSRLKRNRDRDDVLVRLHIRACQVTDEIIVLLETGFAEGARARWRTLFELTVIACLIKEGGDPLARRYVAHEAVDQLRAMNDYNRSAPLLGEPPLPVEEVRAVKEEYEAAIRVYHKQFNGSYGWAAGQLGISEAAQFSELQEKAGSLSMKFYYRLACFGVHGSPKGLTQQPHRFNPGGQAAGACNVGLEEPGSNAAHTLTRLTSLLFDEPWDLDKLAHMRALLSLRDDITTGMYAAARQIQRDEEKLHRQLTRRSRTR